MKGALRIRAKNHNRLNFGDNLDKDKDDNYFSRLIKLIPAEILTLYTIGHTNIPDDVVWAEVTFGVVCCVMLLISRFNATKDDNNEPQWAAIFVSLFSFMIWLYVESPIFALLDLQIDWLGTISMAVWTFLVPYFYHGDESA